MMTLSRHLVLAAVFALAACQHEGGSGDFSFTTPTTPASADPVEASEHMIVAGHPLAAKAGREMLRKGGAAIDAAIAAEMVLTLVEPQSSGIGGGAFLMHYAAKTGAIDAFDGRETAPKSAHPYMFLDGKGKARKRRDAGIGGLGVGVPGLLRMLEKAHKEHGKLPWADLFGPAIKLATDGFPIAERLAGQIAGNKSLFESPTANVYFYENDGSPKKQGTLLKNRDLADTLTRIAKEGADAFYTGDIAKAVAAAVTKAYRNPVKMKPEDISAYKAKKRPPVCLPYRAWLICGMGPPSSGGITTLEILGILQKFDLKALGAGSPKAVHLIAEAGNLAFADRNVFIADPDFVPVPTAGLLDAKYLERRASEISPENAGGKRNPGMPGAGARLWGIPAGGEEGLSTTHMSVIDKNGNAVAMTASNAGTFGSRLMVRGFILNNQLTDFAFEPNAGGAPVANRTEPGKRPRSSMAPTLVFDNQGRVVMAIGSPGGTRIIGFVSKALIATLDWGMDIQAAIDYPNFLGRKGPVEIEEGSTLAKIKPDLELMGHEVKLFKRPKSGLNGITVKSYGLRGGSDKRRDGQALGD
ncbi:MAG: gamma-glutamyltransferase [Rhodospirillales bacterium]|nr:gamma-glutamyltransferase [Rhodospirillales bacterium]